MQYSFLLAPLLSSLSAFRMYLIAAGSAVTYIFRNILYCGNIFWTLGFAINSIGYKRKRCKDEFLALPSSITVREIYYYIVIPGFRTQQVSLITTLLDKATYSTLAIVGLYRQGWDVELDLRHLKTTLGIDVLRCKTPSMVRKEIHVFLLAYNLLRSLMWSAGTTCSTPPNRLSLQGTRHHLINFIPKLLAATSTKGLQIYRNET